MASQLNILHFGGAQIFQMKSTKLVEDDPMNWASYADLVLKVSSAVNFQVMLFGVSW